MLVPHLAVVVDKGLHSLLDDVRQTEKRSSITGETPSPGLISGTGPGGVVTITSSSSASTSSSDRYHDLRRMFLLLERVNSLELLKQGWTAYLKYDTKHCFVAVPE
jgi:hypothetical protein